MPRSIILFLLVFSLACSCGEAYSGDFFNDVVKNGGKSYTDRIRSTLSRNTGTETITLEVEFGKLSETLGGELKSVHIQLSEAHFNKLLVNSSEFTMIRPVIDVQKLYEESKLELKGCESITFEILILEEHLNEFLSSRTDSINVDSPSVRLLENELNLSGRGEVFKMHVRFSVRGRFGLREGKLIDFLPDRAKFNSIPLPKFMIRKLIDRMNPILNLDDFPFELKLEEIIITPGKLIFRNGGAQ